MNNRLYLKISGTLLALLVLLGVCYVLITSYVGHEYHQEVNQKLYGKIAEATVKEKKTIEHGKVDTAAMHSIMQSMMVVNPSIEVYLLDTLGNIITYVAPYKVVKREKVDLGPVREFIAAGEEIPYILGDDPREFDCKKVFSAAPIVHDDNLEGYMYIILASQEQEAVTSALTGSYILRLGTSLFFLTLVGTLLIGLLAIWFLTKNLRSIIATVQRFKEGDYAARIEGKDKGELTVLADTYNDMADQIVANIEQIQSVERLRRELIANVSHDLRTPLAIMQGYIETLIMKDEKIEAEERNKYLNIVMGSSEKLSNLVSQLFEYSKLESNQIEPQKEPFQIAELANDVMTKYQILADQKNIKLEVEVSGQVPLVFADVSLVERVIQNLMDNALKFTPDNGVIKLSIGANDKDVEVRIADSGPGIPEDEQAHIFERYRQAATGDVKAKGAGLGLAIVKKILEIHDAKIRVQSKPNSGTAFWFELPAYSA